MGGWVCPFIIFLLLSCASQAPPPGGPPDRTPPEVAQTRPAPDATRVAPDSGVRIRFSEAMDRRSAEASFFLSPAPQGGLKFRWRKDEMEVLPPGGLHPGRTYLVSVGTGSRDEAGNPLRASFDFAFSTGDLIGRGEIRGRVLSIDKGRSQVYIVAYELTGRGDPDPASDAPDYTTQAASDGAFRFPRLSPGRYRAFAFEDRDRDRSCSPGVDPLSVPAGDALLTESDAVALLGDLRPALRDTARATLTSARAADRTHVALRFTGPVAGPLDAAISGPSGPLSVLAAHLDPADPSRALLLTGEQTPGGTYRVERLSGLSRVEIPKEGGAFKGSGDPDRTPPRIAALRPMAGAENVRPDAPVEIVFSEPMRTTGVSPAWIASDTTEAPPGTFRWPAPDRLTFTPDAPWTPARLHRLLAEGLTDPSGNRLSGDIAPSFTTVDSSRLGGIAGRVSASEGAPPARVCLRAVRVDDPDTEATAILPQPGAYALSGLPAGRYDVTVFLDLNGDGEWTPGRPRPFAPSEPFGDLTEPVTVRPRWTTEDVEIRIETVRYVKGNVE
ncbi:MAG: hypothetical protein A3F84_15785 [Candidatus Handelsmanbacteria bacterium RIFCSPLOWO2_12_FULL_64_10]|uniref:SbsA Ig-like domain-containing protein n=1 Tax=Handelsmanbacteria sp. (strain RIFCSPLOWO2_12_FULL_64_10) TaxID=1817868 RepID=A0A1F6CL95_HANXR|nr:MAG: hypothetical protein A3F84_15785 [Candidatus Handelsmanbacteria bacterium RIFCSPLOWO2_12_FULL_64_10]